MLPPDSDIARPAGKVPASQADVTVQTSVWHTEGPEASQVPRTDWKMLFGKGLNLPTWPDRQAALSAPKEAKLSGRR